MRILVLVAFFSLSTSAIAAGQECQSISDLDSYRYCIGIATKDRNACYNISDNDRRNECTAIVSRDKSYCERIQNSDKQTYLSGTVLNPLP